MQNHRRIPKGIKLNDLILFFLISFFIFRRIKAANACNRIYLHELLRIIDNIGHIFFLFIQITSLKHIGDLVLHCFRKRVILRSRLLLLYKLTDLIGVERLIQDLCLLIFLLFIVNQSA